jgi:hypothetical protein
MPWIMILIEEPIDAQLVENFRSFYGTRRFINFFSTARH